MGITVLSHSFMLQKQSFSGKAFPSITFSRGAGVEEGGGKQLPHPLKTLLPHPEAHYVTETSNQPAGRGGSLGALHLCLTCNIWVL